LCGDFAVQAAQTSVSMIQVDARVHSPSRRYHADGSTHNDTGWQRS
jgi:hypothetical protein